MEPLLSGVWGMVFLYGHFIFQSLNFMAENVIPIEEHIKDIQEITIAIDSWDDLFSDFDPSPLEQRILSEDFLSELKKSYRETPRGSYIVTIYAQMSLKDEASERIVIKRLKQYFKLRHLAIEKEIGQSIQKGFIFVIISNTDGRLSKGNNAPDKKKIGIIRKFIIS